MKYKSTRGNKEEISASLAIIKGLSKDGGLFMPLEISKFDYKKYVNCSYKELAYEVMKLYFSDFTKEELIYCIDKAYDEKFESEDILEISKVNNEYYMELYHGKTLAFKDMALSILPHLLAVSRKKQNIKEDIVILTATSGDTGKAALSGFAGVEGIKIIVFYPNGGVSKIQELQMQTQEEENTKVVAIRGNFDDAQTGVKRIFEDENLKEVLKENNYILSSANSINIGRLIPQVVYYIFTYLKLLKEEEIKEDEKINFVVPTGNFGNILAGYFAKLMGLPINKLILASNENKVLYDFFSTGIYDKNRDFILSSSPSMDILISSNLERLIYLLFSCDEEKVRKLMSSLKEKGRYEIDELKNKVKDDFYANYSTEKDSFSMIAKLFEDYNYLIDPHTAVASSVYEKYKKDTDDKTKTVIVSTASPYKFSESVLRAIKKEELKDFTALNRLFEVSKLEIPKEILKLKEAKVVHDEVIDLKDMNNIIEKFLRI